MSMMNTKKMIVLAGPTASGKTGLSLALAKILDGEIISADSMQVYEGMDIGTAKISREEMEGIPHHLINIAKPSETFNIVSFQRLAKKAAADIFSRGKTPIVVGGTGFYIQSLLYDIDFQREEGDAKLRQDLEREYDAAGSAAFLERVRAVDPVSAANIHPNNKRRMVRAMEYYLRNHVPISAHNESQKQKKPSYPHVFFVLCPPREILYQRINERVEEMLQGGLVEEVQGLLDGGLDEGTQSMEGIGYKEIAAALLGKISMDQAKELLKQNTRHYAKRQITWFKREKGAIWLDPLSFESREALLNHIIERVSHESESI